MHQPKKENRFVFADLIHQQMFSFHPSHNDESERDYTVYKERGRVQGRRIQTSLGMMKRQMRYYRPTSETLHYKLQPKGLELERK